MKDHTKIGKKKGKPIYSTPADFRRQVQYKAQKTTSHGQNFQIKLRSTRVQGKGFRGGR